MKKILFFLSICCSLFCAEREKCRVLCIVPGYPQLSETYVHEELVAIWDDYDVLVASVRSTSYGSNDHFPYHKINGRNPEAELSRLVETFKPDVIHTHWVKNAPIAAKLASKYKIPFTVRSHSFDILDGSLSENAQALRSSWCRRVLYFPGFKQRLVDQGVPEEKLVACWPVVNYSHFYNPAPRELTGRVLNVGAAQQKKDFPFYLEIASRMRGDGWQFDLYPIGYKTNEIKNLNRKMGVPVAKIETVPYSEMPAVYRDHDWIIYTADTKMHTVGLPLAIMEAQASGIGVCLQELPGRREELLEYLGGAGFLFSTIDQVEEILSEPYPEEMRQLGYKNAKKADIAVHKCLVTDVWDEVFLEKAK